MINEYFIRPKSPAKTKKEKDQQLKFWQIFPFDHNLKTFFLVFICINYIKNTRLIFLSKDKNAP